MSNAFFFHRLDVIMHNWQNGNELREFPIDDGKYVRAEDAIARDADLIRHIRELERKLMEEQSTNAALRRETNYLKEHCETAHEARRVAELQKAEHEQENRQLRLEAERRSTD